MSDVNTLKDTQPPQSHNKYSEGALKKTTNLLRILREVVLKLDERITKLEAKSGDNQ